MKKGQHLFFILIAILIMGSCSRNKKETVQVANNSSQITMADEKAIKAREISSWQFAKTKELDKLREILADDYMAMFGKTFMNSTQVIQGYQKTIVKEYRLFNIRVKPITDNVAIIYYEAYQNVVDDQGNVWIPNIAASNTYVKRNNIWYSVFYHETPLGQ
ncbi:MAG TPA: hypothetical protein VK498_10125 [Ferruginibacter sp.]|nr:hypothetical protein [Ferruginibacter sp.]